MKHYSSNFSTSNDNCIKFLFNTQKYSSCDYTPCQVKRCLKGSYYDVAFWKNNVACNRKKLNWDESCPSLQATIQAPAQYR